MASETLGERLRRLREQAGLSHGQLAARVDVGENAIRKIEAGYSKQPSFAVGVRLARALGVSATYLSDGRDPAGGTGPVDSSPAAAALRLERVEASAADGSRPPSDIAIAANENARLLEEKLLASDVRLAQVEARAESMAVDFGKLAAQVADLAVEVNRLNSEPQAAGTRSRSARSSP